MVCAIVFIFLRAVINSSLTFASSAVKVEFAVVRLATDSRSCAVAVAKLAMASIVSCWYMGAWNADAVMRPCPSFKSKYSLAKWVLNVAHVFCCCGFFLHSLHPSGKTPDLKTPWYAVLKIWSGV